MCYFQQLKSKIHIRLPCFLIKCFNQVVEVLFYFKAFNFVVELVWDDVALKEIWKQPKHPPKPPTNPAFSTKPEQMIWKRTIYILAKLLKWYPCGSEKLQNFGEDQLSGWLRLCRPRHHLNTCVYHHKIQTYLWVAE